MKLLFWITGIAGITFCGCGPASRLHETPALYFGAPHSISQTDSIKEIAVKASIIKPLLGNAGIEYRVHKKWMVHFSYSGNFGAFTEIESVNIGKYTFTTSSVHAETGFFLTFKNNNTNWFFLAGYNCGSSTAVVPEYDNSEEFIYKGRFSNVSFTSGFQVSTAKDQNFSISTRQSFVKFTNYQLPDTSYCNKQQFLSDMMLAYSYSRKRFKGTVFFGSFINGYDPGKRNTDHKTSLWRIQRVFAGITFGYHFSGK